MEPEYSIHKAAGVIIRDRKLLLCREFDQDVFIAPGGKLNPGETSEQAVIRELQEELGIQVPKSALQEFGTFYAEAATSPGKKLRMDVFLVTTDADMNPDGEIEELGWFNSINKADQKLGSIFEHDVLPKLRDMNLVD